MKYTIFVSQTMEDMKPIKVKVELKENWAHEKYALYFTKDFNLVELDFPTPQRKIRVYRMDDIRKYVELPSTSVGFVNAESTCKDMLYSKGYYVTEFDYPKELKEMRKEAFKK